MDKSRYDAIMDGLVALTQQEFDEGWHFCVEFDDLLIGPGMGEMDYCRCFEEPRVEEQDNDGQRDRG